MGKVKKFCEERQRVLVLGKSRKILCGVTGEVDEPVGGKALNLTPYPTPVQKTFKAAGLNTRNFGKYRTNSVLIN